MHISQNLTKNKHSKNKMWFVLVLLKKKISQAKYQSNAHLLKLGIQLLNKAKNTYVKNKRQHKD